MAIKKQTVRLKGSQQGGLNKLRVEAWARDKWWQGNNMARKTLKGLLLEELQNLLSRHKTKRRNGYVLNMGATIALRHWITTYTFWKGSRPVTDHRNAPLTNVEVTELEHPPQAVSQRGRGVSEVLPGGPLTKGLSPPITHLLEATAAPTRRHWLRDGV